MEEVEEEESIQEDEEEELDIEAYDYIYGKDDEIESFFDHFISEEDNWKKTWWIF